MFLCGFPLFKIVILSDGTFGAQPLPPYQLAALRLTLRGTPQVQGLSIPSGIDDKHQTD